LKSLKEGAGEYSRLGKEWLGKELKSEKGSGCFFGEITYGGLAPRLTKCFRQAWRIGIRKKKILNWESVTCREGMEIRPGLRQHQTLGTICDSYSRYLFTSKGHYYPTYKAVKEEFKRVFKAYGMPVYMHTDNGVPFGSMQSIQRYSQLSYWLIDLGIYPLFSDPGCPQQNGRHERMHRDLKAYCTQPVSSTLTKQQAVMDRFVGEYNEVRPHEALKMETPGSIHERSSRSYPEKIVAYDYPWSFRKLKVTKNGAIRWGAYNWVYISRGAIKKYVGLEELENGIWKVYYRDVVLGYFDESKIESKEQHLKLSKTIV
jgi:hypothetical protein